MNAEIWKGAAAPLRAGAVEAAAARLGCDVPALRAVLAVEAAGRWFEGDGALPRRFEPHRLRGPAADALGWSGGWRASLAVASGRRAAMFADAFAVDAEAAAAATSWGGPQIMGENAGLVGHVSALAMVAAMAAEAGAQLAAFVSYVEAVGAAAALRAHDWLTFAALYNGRGQAATYAAKIAAAWHAARIEAAAVAHGAAPAAEILREGSRGVSVREAQAALGIAQDGIFGPGMAAEVRAFQAGWDLPVDGMIGARTWAALRGRSVATRAMGRAASPLPVARPRTQAGRVEVAARAIRDASGTASAASVALRGVSEAVGGVPPAILGPIGIAAAVALSAFGVAAAVVYLRRSIRAAPGAV